MHNGDDEKEMKKKTKKTKQFFERNRKQKDLLFNKESQLKGLRKWKSEMEIQKKQNFCWELYLTGKVENQKQKDLH